MSGAPDAIVVGAGVVGAACARELASDGLRVLVLDEGAPASGATAAAMGHIVAMDDSAAQLALTAWSRRLLHELAPALATECELDACGTLWIAEDEEQLREGRARMARFRAGGVEAELIDAPTLAEAEPSLRPGLAGALRVPGDSVLYPVALARWLLQRALERGAELRAGARVEALAPGSVTVAGERLDAGLVVNAAGAGAAVLMPALPIVPRKGHLVVTDRYPGLVRHELVELGYVRSAQGLEGTSAAFNVQPRTTGQLLIGSSRELAGWDASLNRDLLARMLARAVAFLPELARLGILRVWTGFRPATRDHLPFIGAWDEEARLWVAAGHEGLGVTCALGTGKLLADLIAGREPAIDPAPYAPARLLAQA